MGRVAAVQAVVLALVAGCGEPGTLTRGDGGRGEVAIRGRVVDAETCASTVGCQGVEGVVVALLSDPTGVRSAPTTAEGAFGIDGVPAGESVDLIAIPQATSAVRYVDTINPAAADTAEDVYNLDVYAMPRDPDSLLAALDAEGIDLLAMGGYVGQAVAFDGDSWTAADGVAVEVSPPQDTVRYVHVLPRYVDGEPALEPAGATATGPFGLFVVPGIGATAVRLTLSSADHVFDPQITPLRARAVTFALHRAR